MALTPCPKDERSDNSFNSLSEAPFIGGDIEAGALLEPLVGLHYPIAVAVGTEVAVAADFRDGEVFLQRADEGTQGVLLPVGTGVGGLTAGIQAAFVGNADAFLIVAQGVCAHHLQRTGTPDVAVLADNEVIANHFHASCAMAAKEVFLGEVGVGPGGGAMDDKGGYPTHAVTPNAPAIAEATPMMILKMISHVLFFLFSMFFFFFTTEDTEFQRVTSSKL